MEEIQTQACKLPRIGYFRNDSNKIGDQGREQFHDEDDEDGEGKGGTGVGSESDRLRARHSSRIFRVSRATGGKDRHSKVVTAKGLRDRRVRLSVPTAIQFYDLQDRLGVDQPSKAVEWLIKAAASAINELPSLDSKFPETPKKPNDEKRLRASEPGFDPEEVELEAEPLYQQQQHMSLTKSACSSTSETSKGSVSVSRSEIRVKARERARERTAMDNKEKEKHKDESQIGHQHNSQNSSFTELLTGCVNGNSPTATAQQNTNAPNFIFKQTRHFPSTSMDYFTSGLLGPASSRTHYSSGFSGQTHLGITPPPHTMTMPPPFTGTGDHHPELQQFSFLSNHLIPDATAAPGIGGDYNLHFTISSGLAGFNRGTLQSNSPSPLPHLQRYSSTADGPNIPFFVGNVSASAASPAENQFPAGFDGRLHLCYGDGARHSDLKGKGKS